MPSSLTSRLLDCPECGKTFSRPSHLSRHQATHMAPSHRGAIPCMRCDMTFSRRDVLLRHLRSAHQVEGRARRSVQRSCFRCVEKKLKCERTRPCGACFRSDAVCEYSSPDGSEVTELYGNGHHVDTEMSGIRPARTDETGHQYNINEPPATATSPSTSGGYAQQRNGNFKAPPLVGSLATPDSSSGDPPPMMMEHTDQPHVGETTTGPTDLYPGMDPGTAILFTVDRSFDSFVPDMEGNLYHGSLAMSPSGFPLMQPSFRTGGLDWLAVHLDDGISDPCGFNVGAGFDTSHLGLPLDPGIQQTDPATHNGGTQQPILGHHQQWDTQADHATLRPQGGAASQPPSLPWPFEGKEPTPHRHKFPPLRELLSDRWRSNTPSQPALVDGLIHLLSGSRLPRLHTLRENDHVRAFHDFQRLVDSYFARFHDIQAIIHKSTWDMATCPTVLLAAMACMGAMLSDIKADVELSSALSDICSTMITWMGASDDTNYSDISYLNALCIHQIYSLGSGNRQLYQNADRSRGILIGGLRGVGLLQARLNVNSEDDNLEATTTANNSPTDPDALELEWRNWIARESGRRAAWAAFEYDCSLCTLTSRRGILDLSELPAFLPCADHIWSASSAQAWHALRSRLGATNSSPRLSNILTLALAGRELPAAALGFWAKRLCSQVIGRLLWDLKQLEVMAMPEYGGLRSLVSAHRDSKVSLLKGCDVLVEALSAPSSTSDLISYNISGLLCHYSHLYAANDVLDIIVYIVRHLISSADQQQEGIDVARRRLKMNLASDPETSRRLCWHAAQIIVIANEYLVSAPCEILRVFMGYIFILAYSAYGPREPPAVTAAPDGGDERGKPVRLDLPDRDTSQRRSVFKWIRTGGPASLGSVQDLCADGCIPAISRDAQAMMQKLRCWGLADKFTRMFQVFETKGF